MYFNVNHSSNFQTFYLAALRGDVNATSGSGQINGVLGLNFRASKGTLHSGAVGILAGISVEARNSSAAGTITEMVGAKISLYMGGSTNITSAYGFLMGTDFSAGTETVTNLYGLYIPSLTKATNNYAIYTSAGAVRFGDKVMFTQTDGNEYIDSLADGYLDLGATTSIRLNSPLIDLGTGNLLIGGEFDYETLNITRGQFLSYAQADDAFVSLCAINLAGTLYSYIYVGVNEVAFSNKETAIYTFANAGETYYGRLDFSNIADEDKYYTFPNETGTIALLEASQTFTGTPLFGDKIKFTQTDGNEYIDSLADGYMDYGATTAHRFNSMLQTDAGRTRNITTVSAATYDLLITDDILHVTYTSTGAVTSLTLPTAQATEGRTIVIKDAGGNAATNNVTIDTEGSELIDGKATYTLNNDYESITLYSMGGNWYVI
jgi:hypothetical protein